MFSAEPLSTKRAKARASLPATSRPAATIPSRDKLLKRRLKGQTWANFSCQKTRAFLPCCYAHRLNHDCQKFSRTKSHNDLPGKAKTKASSRLAWMAKAHTIAIKWKTLASFGARTHFPWFGQVTTPRPNILASYRHIAQQDSISTQSTLKSPRQGVWAYRFEARVSDSISLESGSNWSTIPHHLAKLSHGRFVKITRTIPDIAVNHPKVGDQNMHTRYIYRIIWRWNGRLSGIPYSKVTMHMKKT